MMRTYHIGELAGDISWPYFFHAWCMKDDQTYVADELKADALRMLERMDGLTEVNTLCEIFKASGDGDDILLRRGTEEFRLPMLRSQRPDSKGFCLCLADFVRENDEMGVFATSTDCRMKSGDVMEQMLVQTLADRLAEAAAERLERDVSLSVTIRPAVGYPSMPDMSLNFLLDRLLHFDRIGVKLTEHGMMQPHASVSGLLITHPSAHYFDVGRIGDEQITDYARRRGVSHEWIRPFLK